MRVAVYYSNHDVRLEERPVPRIGPGEVLMQVEACGICGSDVLEWYRIGKAPLVLGHEVAGVVEAVGEGVKQYRVGDRVAANHHVPCNTCHHCVSGHNTLCDTLRRTNFDPGGFAEHVRLSPIHVDRGIYPLPDDVSFDEGTFVEPLAWAVRGQRLAGMRPGKSVIVIGSGIAGLLHIKLACALGAGRVLATDIAPSRLDAARRFGALALEAGEATPERVRELNDGYLADVVLVCTGAGEAFVQALGLVERGGTVLLFGMPQPETSVPLPLFKVMTDGITITSSYANTREDALTAVKLIQQGRVQVADMITHRLTLAETGKGFQLVSQARESLKVIIQPQR
jgi:L-iditol 2-dehydrogenase